MKLLAYRVLEAPSDLDLFLSRFAHFVGIRLPLEYLQQGRVVAAYDEHGRMMGGYAIICGPVFRSLQFLPEAVQEGAPFLRCYSRREFVEANAVWLSPAVRSPLESMRFWWRVRQDILASGRRFLIVMHNRRAHALRYFYEFLHPVSIYEGASATSAGKSSHSEIFVGYVNRWNLQLSKVRYLPEVLRRVTGFLKASLRSTLSEAHLRRAPSVISLNPPKQETPSVMQPGDRYAYRRYNQQ